jgi:ABC-2 type transport system ATP-binding protein
MQREFFDIIREENERGATVLFSSHILSEVQKLCNRVAIIKDGSIIRIDEVCAINRQAYKKFRITADNFSGAELPSAEISDFEQKGNEISFIFRGNLDEMVKLISRHHVIDIQIEEPTLEEIFMHYYE